MLFLVKDENDPVVQLANASLRSIGSAFEYFALDCFPWRAWQWDLTISTP